MISLKQWRHSKAFRFVSLLVLLDFATSQNLYASGDPYVLNESGVYQPAQPIPQDPASLQQEQTNMRK